MHTRSVGNLGEDIACKFLEKNGFVIAARNYRKKWGELDVVAREGDMLTRETHKNFSARIHFFEVKSINVWSLDNIGGARGFKGHNPEENVHSFKTKQIRRMIQTYMMESVDGVNGGVGMDFQFHVLCVYIDQKARRGRVRWLRDIVL